MPNVDHMQGVEIRGVSMKCGIFHITIISPIFHERNIWVDSNVPLHEALKEIAHVLEFENCADYGRNKYLGRLKVDIY